MFKFLISLKKLLNNKQFKKNPILILFRLITLSLLDFFRITKEIKINHHEFKFKFFYIPSLKIKSGGRGIFLFREKIEDLLEFGHQFIKKGDHCIDGGANQGIFSLSFSSAVGLNGKVVAVEPFDYCVKSLKHNIQLNKFENIHVCQEVLYNKPGLIKKLDFTNGVGGASIVRDFGYLNHFEVKTNTVDNIVKKFDLNLNFLKLDIEGAEYDALKGSIKSLAKNRPIICLEGDPNNYSKISEFLKGFNYSPYYFENKKLEKLKGYKPLTNIFFLT